MIGKTLSHYEILGHLGAGGMGEVFRGRDARLGREVALKVLPVECCGDPSALARFGIEAKAASALNHPGICTIYDVGEQDGQPFLVMECLDGQSLDLLLAEGPMSDAAIIDIGAQIADALATAHEAGILHRDIKPANVILTRSGRAKLLDFGLAKFAPALLGGGAVTLSDKDQPTLAGTLLGTVGYMSPEQALGKELDARSDLFSFGVLLYEMATGRAPFAGDTIVATLDEILNRTPTSPSQIVPALPAHLESTILKLLEKKAANRPQSAVEVAGYLSQGRTTELSHEQAFSDELEDARRAFAQRDWAQAFEIYSRITHSTPLSGQDLRAHSMAAFWLGQDDLSSRLQEQAHARYLDEGDKIRAGEIAAEIAELHHGRGSTFVFNGWMRRAEALLAEAPDSVENGRFLRLKTMIALQDSELDRAEELQRRVKEIAGRTGDLDLAVLAAVDEGQLHVLRGRVAEGMALLDEAMASALGSSVDIETVGRTYCNMISACGLIGDFRRAIEWNDQAVKWCDPHSSSFYPGLCSVHRAGVLRERGEWDAAEAQARRATDDHDGFKAGVARAAYYELGEVLLRRGQLDTARAAFDEAYQRGHDVMPGLALLHRAEGRPDLAVRMLERALEEAPHALRRLRLLPAAIEVALDVDNMEAASSMADEIQDLIANYDAPIFVGNAHLAQGAVALARADHSAAIASLRAALKEWNEGEMPYRAAQTRVLLSRAYEADGDEGAAAMELRAARAIFESLGAELDLRSL